MTGKRRHSSLKIEPGSGNVYADLGVANPERMLVKAKLVSAIAEIIADGELSQVAAAELLELTQPKLSNLLRGQFHGVSERRLMDCLTRLGRDVDIVIKDKPRAPGPGKLSVRHLKGMIAKPSKPVTIRAMGRSIARGGSGG